MFQSDIEKPTNSSSASELLGHRPLKNTDNDALGYAQFAEELAKAIGRIAPRDGVVLALYGSWGSGKSTMLQFVETALRRLPDQDCPAIIRFNPWWLSGQEELKRVFFKELIRGLGQSALAKQGVDAKPLLREIAKLSLKFVPSVGDDLSKIFDELTKEKPKTMEQARSEISDKLERVSSKILVIIDDIDRLTAEEIRLMFRLIKTVADFPNIIYLLAFDKRVVLSALGSEQASSEDYLAKIVQISFELPLPGQDALRTMLEQRLRKILGDTPGQLFDPFEWSSAYGDNVHRLGIGYFMRTPRDVVRLMACTQFRRHRVRCPVLPALPRWDNSKGWEKITAVKRVSS
jgi:predicted KAP-like P-loop ATPase